jgi:quinol monooxygenase YgiN
MESSGPLLRIFEVRTKPGCAPKLLENFATTSADVVRNEPGNRGYFFGQCLEGGEDTVMFVSLWENLDAVKTRFGEDWQVSYMPPGYEDLIDECTVRHFDMAGGWNVTNLTAEKD